MSAPDAIVCAAMVPDGADPLAADAWVWLGYDTAPAAIVPDGTDTSAPEAWVWLADATLWSLCVTVSAA